MMLKRLAHVLDLNCTVRYAEFNSQNGKLQESDSPMKQAFVATVCLIISNLCFASNQFCRVTTGSDLAGKGSPYLNTANAISEPMVEVAQDGNTSKPSSFTADLSNGQPFTAEAVWQSKRFVSIVITDRETNNLTVSHGLVLPDTVNGGYSPVTAKAVKRGANKDYIIEVMCYLKD